MTMPASDRPNRRLQEHLTDAELNELVDGTLAASEQQRAQAHLSTCEDCTERYRTLQATVSALQSAPSLMPRRSFQLTPEQARIPEKVPTWLDRFSNWVVPGVPAIRAATLAVALLLLSVTAIDVITHRNDASENAGPIVMRQAESTEQPVLGQAPRDAAPTTIPPLMGQSAAGDTSADAANATGGGANNANDGAETSGAESEVAPAAAIPASETAGSAMEEAPQTMMQAVPESSPVAAPAPAAIASSIPATPEATPTAAESTSGDRTVSISRWRIAEFGLLLLLLWLAVTWFGRTRVPDEPESS